MYNYLGLDSPELNPSKSFTDELYLEPLHYGVHCQVKRVAQECIAYAVTSAERKKPLPFPSS